MSVRLNKNISNREQAQLVSLVFVDKYVHIMVENRFNSLDKKKRNISLSMKWRTKFWYVTKFWYEASDMTPPFVAACKPKSVGPNTIERFELDIEFSAECWLTLTVNGGQHHHYLKRKLTDRCKWPKKYFRVE